MRKLLVLAAAGCGLWAAVTAAQAQSAEAAPPDRVARLAVIDGSASLLPAGSQNWGNASINRPLGTGDKLWIPEGSRASLELGGTEIRLDGGSGFGFLHLGNQTAQAQLTSGTLNLNVRHLYSGQDYEIDTPTLAFVARQRGQYRIDIAPGGKGTQVTVFSGAATVYGQGGAERHVSAGNSYRFLDSSLTQVEVFAVPAPDSFDRWCFARDARYQRNYSNSREYVSSEVIGYQDLAGYGSWQNEINYGPMWFPTAVPMGWAPYRYGHWAWIAPWGWTWIDNAPWGFAPFHYGRWAYVGNRWGWVPGPMAMRPIYAPALVAFVGGFGGGFGWNVGVGLGGPVGWYPLEPGAVFVPWYRCGPRYFRDVNVTNIRVVNRTTINNINNTYNIYRRRGHLNFTQIGDHRISPRALTMVPHDVFVGAHQIGPHMLVARPHGTVLRGPLALGAPPAPGRGSLMAPNHGLRPNVPRPIFARNVLAHRPPRQFMNALPQHADGYRLARGDRARPMIPVQPVRIADNVRVIGQHAQPGVHQGRGNIASSQVPRIERARGPTAAVPMARALGQRQGVMPSADFVPHRWQPATLPRPARIEPAPMVAPNGRAMIRRQSGAQVIQGRPQGGSFSVMPGNRNMPPAQMGGRSGYNAPRDNYPQAPRANAYVPVPRGGFREARPRGPYAQGTQVIAAPRTQYYAPRGGFPAAPPREPAYAQGMRMPPPPRMPQYQQPVQQFRAPPQAARPMPSPRIRVSEPHPPRVGGGRH
ncbi:MAG: DUF6600 domain-containing protein [Metallibacterium sp.]